MFILNCFAGLPRPCMFACPSRGGPSQDEEGEPQQGSGERRRARTLSAVSAATVDSISPDN